MIYTSCSSVDMKKYFKTYMPKIISFDNIGCGEIEDKIFNLIKTQEEDCIIYNVVAIDYVEPDKIIFIDSNGLPHNFKEFFKEKLKYMFPGEILLNLHNNYNGGDV